MTALNKYQRLEASGLWRTAPDEQRREVIASIGDATLVISDLQDRPLTHWSIAAIKRGNPGKLPAIYHPAGDSSETLELADNESEMVAAIEKLQKAIHRKESHPGRLRSAAFLTTVAVIAAGAIFWLPVALRNHADSTANAIETARSWQDVLAQMTPVTGQACREEIATGVLAKLAMRLNLSEIVVVPGGLSSTASLPGGVVMLSRSILEDHEDPAVAAGYVIAEALRAEAQDPLAKLLKTGGPWASFRLLTTGQLHDETLADFAETLAGETPAPVDQGVLAQRFAELQIPATPYAYALDISGETTLDLIETDALLSKAPPVMSDGEWVALQEICTN